MQRYKALFLTIAISLALGGAIAQEAPRKCTKNDIKLTLLSLGSGSTRITYERAFTPMYAAEFTVGAIGLGWDFLHHLHSRGVLFKGAFKWTLIPQKKANSWLAGFYVKPELVASLFKYRDKMAWVEGETDLFRTRQVALLGECGYQLVLRWFVFDVYTGMGGAFGTGNMYNYYHSFMHLPKDWPLVFTAGFRLGVAF